MWAFPIVARLVANAIDADTYAARSAFLILKPNETGHTSLVEATRPGNLA